MSQTMHLKNTLNATREIMCIKDNTEAFSRNHCDHTKAMCYIFCVCVSVCVCVCIQHANRMRCSVLSSVACQALQKFSALYCKRQDYHENVTEYNKCVLNFSTPFV
jgi:hypothetical protein